MPHRSIVLLAAETISTAVKMLPGTRQALHSPRVQELRYWLALHFERRQNFTFTQFHRLPTQLEALVGPVLDFLGGPTRTEPLRIVVLGCSTGAEPVSIASCLLQRFPSLAFSIDAYDIDRQVLETAGKATYTPREVLENRFITPTFVANTFDHVGNEFRVKRHIAERVRFARADMLDQRMPALVKPADIVVAQNVMCNMDRPAARRAFAHAAALLKPRSALFVDGMDLDMRARATSALGLRPLPFAVERIHNEARVIRGDRYPWFAAGLEPFAAQRPDVERRYATAFLSGSP